MARLIPIGLALVAALAAPGLAHAGRAAICYTPWSSSSAPPTNATVFTCPDIGNLTVPQLAAQRWRIGGMKPLSRQSGPTTFEYTIQLVIQEEWIFRSGFDG